MLQSRSYLTKYIFIIFVMQTNIEYINLLLRTTGSKIPETIFIVTGLYYVQYACNNTNGLAIIQYRSYCESLWMNKCHL